MRGRGKQAARWLAEQSGDVGYAEAGDRFAVTREAVRQAWQLLDLGETPREKALRQQREAILDLARAGKTAGQIEELTGTQRQTIARWCQEADVELTPGLPGRGAADPVDVAAGLEVVRSGGSIAEGAGVAGLQYAAFHRHVRRAKIEPSAFDQTKRRLGRSAQAAQLVEREGMSVGDAAQVCDVSPGSVRLYMRRHVP